MGIYYDVCYRFPLLLRNHKQINFTIFESAMSDWQLLDNLITSHPCSLGNLCSFIFVIKSARYFEFSEQKIDSKILVEYINTD